MATAKGMSPRQRRKEIDAIASQIVERCVKDGRTVHELVAEFGISETALYRLFNREGIRPNSPHSGGFPRKFSDEVELQIVAAYQDGVSMETLATQYDGWRGSIKNVLTRHGVPLRRRGGVTQPLEDGLEEQLCADWHAGMSQRELAEKYGVHETKVNRVLRRYPAVGTKRKRREWHPHWKGGRRHHLGYVMVLLETDHPFHDTMANDAGYVLEHRLVMAEFLGRPLTPTETVHHIDGDRSNNTLSNLQLRQGKHGTGIVYHCADCGSFNVVAQALGDAPDA